MSFLQNYENWPRATNPWPSVGAAQRNFKYQIQDNTDREISGSPWNSTEVEH